MTNQVRVHADIAKTWQTLATPQRKKLWWKKRLETDATAGDRLQRRPRQKIPRLETHRTLWRLPLPDGWRALYTIQVKEARPVLILILWIGDHTQYDRLLGYKTG